MNETTSPGTMEFPSMTLLQPCQNYMSLCVRIGKNEGRAGSDRGCFALAVAGYHRDRQSPLYNQDLDDRNLPAAKSITGTKHLIACAQPVIEEIGEGFDPSNALEARTNSLFRLSPR
jgi:hypothetical protein